MVGFAWRSGGLAVWLSGLRRDTSSQHLRPNPSRRRPYVCVVYSMVSSSALNSAADSPSDGDICYIMPWRTLVAWARKPITGTPCTSFWLTYWLIWPRNILGRFQGIYFRDQINFRWCLPRWDIGDPGCMRHNLYAGRWRLLRSRVRQKGDGVTGRTALTQLLVAEKIGNIYRPMWKLSEVTVAPNYAGWAGS